MCLYLLGQATDCWNQEQGSVRRDCWLKTHYIYNYRQESNIKRIFKTCLLSWLKVYLLIFVWKKRNINVTPWHRGTQPLSLTLVILLRREVSMGRFLEMGTVFQPSSWGGAPRPGVCGPPRPPGPPPPILPPELPPDSFLEIMACCTFICSLCSSSSASLWIWSMVLGPWSPRRGTQLFWDAEEEKMRSTGVRSEWWKHNWQRHFQLSLHMCFLKIYFFLSISLFPLTQGHWGVLLVTDDNIWKESIDQQISYSTLHLSFSLKKEFYSYITPMFWVKAADFGL